MPVGITPVTPIAAWVASGDYPPESEACLRQVPGSRARSSTAWPCGVWLAVNPGSGLAEEPVSGCKPAALV